jgi:ubiquinone/menaquinone biosynthesis C-methylase UbiE
MKNWRSLYQERGVVQKEPSAKVMEAIDFFRSAQLKTVLDLGCGTGRHTEPLFRNGFTVYGCDSSAAALHIARGTLPEVQYQQCDMRYLPYREQCVDGVISHAVIQHGTVATIRQVIGEIQRVLTSGGILFLTVVSTDHPEYFTGQEIEPGTKINIDAIDGDMPHHYFTELEHYAARSEKNPERMAATWALYAGRRQKTMG